MHMRACFFRILKFGKSFILYIDYGSVNTRDPGINSMSFSLGHYHDKTESIFCKYEGERSQR